ncbi:MAG: hypothetical protein Kow0062_05540 [Acidobacteriota bacterium]
MANRAGPYARRPARHRLARCLAIVLPLAAIAPGGTANTSAPSEGEVKAALVHKLTQFVTWPARPAGAPLRVAVVGRDEDAAELVRLFDQADGAAQVRRVESMPDPAVLQDIDVVYVARDSPERFCAVMAAVDGRPVLVATDAEKVLPQGAVVGLRLERRRVRLLIDNRRAQKIGLRLDARVLRLARLVEGTPICDAAD